MPDDFCPINPKPYPVHVPNGVYDYTATSTRMELWDNKVIWAMSKDYIDVLQPAIPVTTIGSPSNNVPPPWGTYPDLPPRPEITACEAIAP